MRLDLWKSIILGPAEDLPLLLSHAADDARMTQFIEARLKGSVSQAEQEHWSIYFDIVDKMPKIKGEQDINTSGTRGAIDVVQDIPPVEATAGDIIRISETALAILEARIEDEISDKETLDLFFNCPVPGVDDV